MVMPKKVSLEILKETENSLELHAIHHAARKILEQMASTFLNAHMVAKTDLGKIDAATKFKDGKTALHKAVEAAEHMIKG